MDLNKGTKATTERQTKTMFSCNQEHFNEADCQDHHSHNNIT